MAGLWAQAFAAGVQAAGTFGISLAVFNQLLQADAVSQLSSDWLAEITGTRMDRLAAILAAGGSSEDIEHAITAMLGDRDAANLIVITELNRAENAGRFAAYQNAGVPKVRWITTSKDPCPVCLANEAAGARYLGDPFPSGAIAPPEHPQCQCVLEPA